MPFAYWSDTTEHMRALSRIAADVWVCKPYTCNPNAHRVPLAADFCPDEPAAMLWHPADERHALYVWGMPMLESLEATRCTVTTAPTDPGRAISVLPFADACRAVDALVRQNRCTESSRCYRGLCTDVVPPSDPGNASEHYRARVLGDGVVIASAARESKADAVAACNAWMRWVRCSWYEIRREAMRHSWRALAHWAEDAATR